jgi:Fe-S cluster assembly protein SufD
VSLAEFLRLDSPSALDVLGAPDDAGADPMISLNAAFAADGVVLLVPDGCVSSKPIEIVHLTTGGEGAAWFTRSFARIGKNANVKLLNSRVGPDGVVAQSNSYLGLELGEGAEVAMVDLQNEGDATQHVATFAAGLSARAVLRHVAVANGGETSRLQAFASLNGEGAWLSAAGANMLSGKEHGDIAWRIDHHTPGSTSRVLYKNVAADTAFGAFQGLILVRPDAQKTDGRMMTRTLLLSDEAKFAAKPELEIYADDVQCGHGATIGQIDDDALFYLMARGIPRAEAMGLLVHAFLAEAVEALGDAAIGEALLPMLSNWLKDRAS